MKAFFKRHLLPLAIIICVSIYSLWPILQDPTRRVADKWDGVLMVWYLNQTIQKIPNDLGNIFQADIFYSYKNVMAYSDMFIPSAFISVIPTFLSGEPIVALNTSLLFGQITTVLICYLWFWEFTKNKTASLISSVALGVSVARVSFIVHLQMWNQQWWLLSVFLFWKYFRKHNLKYLIVSALFWAIQLWESPLGVYFAVTVMFFVGVGSIKTIIKKKTHFVIFIILAILMMILPARAYFSVSNEFNYVRTIRDAARFSPGIDVFFKNIFTDGVFVGLLILALTRFRKMILKEKWLLGIFLVGLVMSLGPVLKIGSATFKMFGKFFIPLPYGIFYYIVPGFSAFRAPGRWVWVSLFAAAFLFCVIFSQILKKKISAYQRVSLIILLFIVIFPITKTIDYYEFERVNEYPKVYSYLKDLPRGVLLELPVYSWAHGNIAAIETQRMVYSLYHGKYLLGGVSGFEPPSWSKDRKQYWQEFPGNEFDVYMKERGVDYMLIWKDLMDEERLENAEERYKPFLYNDLTHVLYKI